VLRRFGLALAVTLVGAGCSDALEQTSSAGQVIAVVNSAANTVSFVSATDFSVRTLDMQTRAGVPTTAAGRGNRVVVPLGPADSVAVINNVGLCTTGTCVRPVVVFPLAAGSGATGVAIQDDSTAWVANPKLNSVTRLNLLRGDTTSVRVGVYPQAVALVRGRVFVANGNLVSGAPAGPTWLSAFPCCGALGTPDSVPLVAGANARFLAVGDDSLLYVVTSGHVGRADGKVSVVDPVMGRELVVINGLGESPGAAAFHPSGRLLVASASEGILEINTLTRSVTRGPGQGVKPGGHGVAGLAIDQAGRVYALDAGACSSAGMVHVLGAPPDYDEKRVMPVGVCPSAAAVAVVP
jgi:streptogramin lyase